MRPTGFWPFFGGVMFVVAMAALIIWWLDGAWSGGALPTHGMVKAVTGSLAALLLIGFKIYLDRRR